LTDDGAFGADDVAGIIYAGERLRKQRFLMNGHGARLDAITTDEKRSASESDLPLASDTKYLIC
jgi:hypothetical protein